jgi:hypothetical protein
MRAEGGGILEWENRRFKWVSSLRFIVVKPHEECDNRIEAKD